MHEIMATDRSFANFRTKLKGCNPPCIPYLGVYLTDLTFIEDGNPDTVGDLISFYKRRLVSSVIRDIQQYQQKPYCLESVGIIKDYLLKVKYLSADEQYRISLLREERGGAPPKEKVELKKQTTVSMFKQVKRKDARYERRGTCSPMRLCD